MIKYIDITPGVLKHYEFEINESKPFKYQSSLFHEDMIQISFENDKYIIDVGWYPEADENGNFKVYLIEDFIWDNPIIVIECNDIKKLKENIEKSVVLFRYLIKEKLSNPCVFEVRSTFDVERGIVLVRNGGGILALNDTIIDVSTLQEYIVIGTSHLYSSDLEHMKKLNENPPILVNDNEKEKHIGRLYIKK